MGNCFNRRRQHQITAGGHHHQQQQQQSMGVSIDPTRNETDDGRYVLNQGQMQQPDSPSASPQEGGGGGGTSASPTRSPSTHSTSSDSSHQSLQSTEPDSADVERARQERERLRALADEAARRDREAMTSALQAYQVPVLVAGSSGQPQAAQPVRPTSLNTPGRAMQVMEDGSVKEVVAEPPGVAGAAGSLPAPAAATAAPHSLPLPPKPTSAASQKNAAPALPKGGSVQAAVPKGVGLPVPAGKSDGKSTSIKKKQPEDKGSSSLPKPTTLFGDKPAGSGPPALPVQRSLLRQNVPFGSQTRLKEGGTAGPGSELKVIQTRVVQAGGGGSGGGSSSLPPPKIAGGGGALPAPHSLPASGGGGSHALPAAPGLPAPGGVKTAAAPQLPAAAPKQTLPAPHSVPAALPGPPPPSLPPPPPPPAPPSLPAGAALPAPGGSAHAQTLPAPRGAGVLPSPTSKPGQLPPPPGK